MAQQTINYGTSVGDLDADLGRNVMVKINSNFTELYTAIDGIIKERINIGAWDMDANETKDVAWTLPADHLISGIQVIIYRDTGGGTYQLDWTDPNGNICGDFYYDGTTFKLYRFGTFSFDSVNFDSTTINRGLIVVEYYPEELS
jgi:hypothetical protein